MKSCLLSSNYVIKFYKYFSYSLSSISSFLIWRRSFDIDYIFG